MQITVLHTGNAHNKCSLRTYIDVDIGLRLKRGGAGMVENKLTWHPARPTCFLYSMSMISCMVAQVVQCPFLLSALGSLCRVLDILAVEMKGSLKVIFQKIMLVGCKCCEMMPKAMNVDGNVDAFYLVVKTSIYIEPGHFHPGPVYRRFPITV